MSFKKKIPVLIVLILTFVCVLLSVFDGEKRIRSAVRTMAMPFGNGIANIKIKIDDIKSYFVELDFYKEQNKILKYEVSRLESKVKAASDYEKEIIRLEGLLDLTDKTNQDYHAKAAKIVSYSSNNWYDALMLNKGSDHGVLVGDTVISFDGLVGRIIETGNNYSIASTIINSDNCVGAQIVRNHKLAMVEGDPELMWAKLCKMKVPEGIDKVNVGDVLATTGDGAGCPEGISIGKIIDIKTDNSGYYAIVEPFVDFSGLSEVVVVGQKK